MEVYIFRHKTWKERYSCDYFSQEEWNAKGIPRYGHGFFSITFSTIALVFYIPCLIVMKRKEFIQNTCYKIMFYLGVIDVLSQIIDGFINGFLLVTGAVFCSMPNFIYVSGTFAFSIWCSQCGLCFFLAINRFLDTCGGKELTDVLFSGFRTHLWCIVSILYGLVMVVVPPPILFTSIGGSWFYDPYFGFNVTTEAKYYNPMMGVNNIGITVVLFVLYTGMIAKLCLQSRSSGGQVHIQKTIFLQAAFICLLNAITGLVYLYMQFFEPPEWVIVGAAITWQGSNGGPAFVYILFNRTIQRNVFRMLGFRKTCKRGGGIINGRDGGDVESSTAATGSQSDLKTLKGYFML
ncbi:hypothetical protein QR680_018500 [Steinernema hermaphroditum]|uniref:Uncharacterized protein n=1 Tax=Steinernema hermaphroditum TaxID=289476 RepID=A0AA39HKH1_9BILA|nr:hypothetical protein QR680_018500 [Steinernema hermaphroditum]